MPSYYNESSPRLFKSKEDNEDDKEEVIINHNHDKYNYEYEKPLIKGCIVFFSDVLEDKNLDLELRRAAKCAIAEDQTRIELIENAESMERERNKVQAHQPIACEPTAEETHTKCCVIL